MIFIIWQIWFSENIHVHDPFHDP